MSRNFIPPEVVQVPLPEHASLPDRSDSSDRLFERRCAFLRLLVLIPTGRNKRMRNGNQSSIGKFLEPGDTFSLKARIIPLKVAATSVKLAIPPPMRRALLRPSGSAAAH